MIYKLIRKLIWFFKRLFRDSKRSKGETIVYNYLKRNKLKFKEQYYVMLPEVARNSKHVFIDFMVYVDDNVYAIEYNGRQHYEYTPFFHKNGMDDYKKQVRRDKLVKNWCLQNQIIFLEIPYYLAKYQIEDFLRIHLV